MSDITELKAFNNPPEKVKTVLSALAVLLGLQTDWASCRKMLGNNSFLGMLTNYDKDNISDAIIKKLSSYLADPEFNYDSISKVSSACAAFVAWIIAMNEYHWYAKQMRATTVQPQPGAA